MKPYTPLLLFFLTILPFSHSSNFLPRTVGKTVCPNLQLTKLALLIALAEDDEPLFESFLTDAERVDYEEKVTLKRGFAQTMSYVPQSFSPERESYWADLRFLVIIFVLIAIIPTACIIVYIILRFVCKKCVGPQKISKVNKNYRNFTWAMMIISSLAVTVLFAIILGKSVIVHNGMVNAFEPAAVEITKSDTLFEKINSAVVVFRNANLDVPDDNYMQELKTTIETYIKNTKERTQQIIDDEAARENNMIILFVIVNIFTILSYLFFFFKFEKTERVLAIIMLFVVPFMIVVEGYNAKFFFYYGDICDTVNGALYSNEIPVADQALGYYYNCFPLKTKAQLYELRYKLYDAAYNHAEDQEEIVNTYETLNSATLEPVFNCEMVSTVIPLIEKEFCKDGLGEMYNVLLLLTWLLLALTVEAIGTRRLEVLIWKRRMEIESMLQNQEVLF